MERVKSFLKDAKEKANSILFFLGVLVALLIFFIVASIEAVARLFDKKISLTSSFFDEGEEYY